VPVPASGRARHRRHLARQPLFRAARPTCTSPTAASMNTTTACRRRFDHPLRDHPDAGPDARRSTSRSAGSRSPSPPDHAEPRSPRQLGVRGRRYSEVASSGPGRLIRGTQFGGARVGAAPHPRRRTHATRTWPTDDRARRPERHQSEQHDPGGALLARDPAAHRRPADVARAVNLDRTRATGSGRGGLAHQLRLPASRRSASRATSTRSRELLRRGRAEGVELRLAVDAECRVESTVKPTAPDPRAWPGARRGAAAARACSRAGSSWPGAFECGVYWFDLTPPTSRSPCSRPTGTRPSTPRHGQRGDAMTTMNRPADCVAALPPSARPAGARGAGRVFSPTKAQQDPRRRPVSTRPPEQLAPGCG